MLSFKRNFKLKLNLNNNNKKTDIELAFLNVF